MNQRDIAVTVSLGANGAVKFTDQLPRDLNIDELVMLIARAQMALTVMCTQGGRPKLVT